MHMGSGHSVECWERLRAENAALRRVIAAAEELSLYEHDITDRVKIARFNDARAELAKLDGGR
jgi:hypothetical protein